MHTYSTVLSFRLKAPINALEEMTRLNKVIALIFYHFSLVSVIQTHTV